MSTRKKVDREYTRKREERDKTRVVGAALTLILWSYMDRAGQARTHLVELITRNFFCMHTLIRDLPHIGPRSKSVLMTRLLTLPAAVMNCSSLIALLDCRSCLAQLAPGAIVACRQTTQPTPSTDSIVMQSGNPSDPFQDQCYAFVNGTVLSDPDHPVATT